MCWTVRENFDCTKWIACFGNKWKEFDTKEEAESYAKERNDKLFANGKFDPLEAI